MDLIKAVTLISFLLFTNFQCDEIDCDPVQNQATLNVDLFPEQIDYSIGDTIILSTKFETWLTLTNRNETIPIENGMCTLELLVMKLGLPPDSLKGYSDFEIINFSGNLHQDYITDTIAKRYDGYLDFNCNADTCAFRIGLVPKVKGKYCIVLGLGYIELQDTSQCPPQNRLLDNVFNVSSYHREIFQELHIQYPILLPSMYTSRYKDIIEDDGAYAFSVK